MNKLTQALMEELTVEYVKVGSLQIPESVVISWVIMLLLVVGSILLTRNLKVDHISKRQAALEALYSLGKNFFEGLLGKEGSRCASPSPMPSRWSFWCWPLTACWTLCPPQSSGKRPLPLCGSSVQTSPAPCRRSMPTASWSPTGWMPS